MSENETDVVVIGSGIGGLSCAALLARYGFDVTVCESHFKAWDIRRVSRGTALTNPVGKSCET